MLKPFVQSELDLQTLNSQRHILLVPNSEEWRLTLTDLGFGPG
jgi:hypothetical protein